MGLRGDASVACTIWTFCPEERCFAFDIHKHEFGECWLKWQSVNHTHPKDPHEGHKTYPTIMRHAPRKIWPWAVSEEIWTGPMPAEVPMSKPAPYVPLHGVVSKERGTLLVPTR